MEVKEVGTVMSYKHFHDFPICEVYQEYKYTVEVLENFKPFSIIYNQWYFSVFVSPNILSTEFFISITLLITNS